MDVGTAQGPGAAAGAALARAGALAELAERLGGEGTPARPRHVAYVTHMAGAEALRAMALTSGRGGTDVPTGAVDAHRLLAALEEGCAPDVRDALRARVAALDRCGPATRYPGGPVPDAEELAVLVGAARRVVADAGRALRGERMAGGPGSAERAALGAAPTQARPEDWTRADERARAAACLDYARDDVRLAGHLATHEPGHRGLAAYWARQGAETALKGLWHAAQAREGARPYAHPHTHDLGELLRALPPDLAAALPREALALLRPHGPARAFGNTELSAQPTPGETAQAIRAARDLVAAAARLHARLPAREIPDLPPIPTPAPEPVPGFVPGFVPLASPVGRQPPAATPAGPGPGATPAGPGAHGEPEPAVYGGVAGAGGPAAPAAPAGAAAGGRGR